VVREKIVGIILSGVLTIVIIGVGAYFVYVFSKFILKFLYEKEGQIKRVILSVFNRIKENVKGKWAEEELSHREQARKEKADAEDLNRREQACQKKEEQESINQTEQSEGENEGSGSVQKKLRQKLKWVFGLALIWLVSVIVALYFLSSLFPDLNFAMLVY
jgi:hypothetical protein